MQERFVTPTQAAKILGYKSTISINRLIEEGYLKGYKIPLSNRPKFKLEDVMNIATPEPLGADIATENKTHLSEMNFQPQT